MSPSAFSFRYSTSCRGKGRQGPAPLSPRSLSTLPCVSLTTEWAVAHLPQRVKLGPLWYAVFARLVLANEVVVHCFPIDQRQCIRALLFPGPQPGGDKEGRSPLQPPGPLLWCPPTGPQFPHIHTLWAPQSFMEKQLGLGEPRSVRPHSTSRPTGHL